MKTNNNIAKGIGAVVLAGVIAAGVCCTGFASRGDDGKWFGNGNLSTWHWNDKTDDKTPDDLTTGHDLVNVIEENGISLMSAVIPVSDYAVNGISEHAENAYTLTASILPENADNKAVDWSVSWINGSSAWAAGKTVTDYVTVTPTSDGALTATVTCVQAFGEQIHVRCTSRDNTDAYAICSVDYEKKVVDVSVRLFSQLEAGSSYCMLKSSVNKNIVPADMGFCFVENISLEYSAYTVDKSYSEVTLILATEAEVEKVLRDALISTSSSSGTLATVIIGDLSGDARPQFEVNRSVFAAFSGAKNIYGLKTTDYNAALSAMKSSKVYENNPILNLSVYVSGQFFGIPIYCSAEGFIINVQDVNMDDSGIIF